MRRGWTGEMPSTKGEKEVHKFAVGLLQTKMHTLEEMNRADVLEASMAK